jgi:hypothetical protein
MFDIKGDYKLQTKARKTVNHVRLYVCEIFSSGEVLFLCQRCITTLVSKAVRTSLIALHVSTRLPTIINFRSLQGVCGTLALCNFLVTQDATMASTHPFANVESHQQSLWVLLEELMQDLSHKLVMRDLKNYHHESV